ncbi:type II secretion system protein [Candidatus Peregrinibacteria bacterium]|nr:type II secretion system protein [Candidatus Peregrinibacteria bacterium]
MNKLSKKGFTLIELLIVISIIGILAVALLPQILSAPASARDTAKQAALNQIAVALEQHNAASGSYPNAGLASGECMEQGIASPGTAQAALKPYFKNGDIPKIEGVVPSPDNPIPSACKGILYCKLTGNRYFLAVAMESPAVQGKSRFTSAAALTGCETGATDPATLLENIASTNTYGILN